MTTSEISTEVLPNEHQGNGQWLQITPGERFKTRTSVEETEGAFAMLELVADPRNGAPMHVHKNEDEHFIVLEGTLHIANGDKTLDAPAGTAVTVRNGVPHAWCNLSETPLRMLLVFSPGYIERLLEEVAARQSDDIATILDKFGCLIVGPALLEGVYSINSPRITYARHNSLETTMTNEELKTGNNGYQIPLGSGLRKVERNEGDTFDVAGVRFTWKVKGEDTGYPFSIYEQELEPREGVPLHCHAYGEVFYVLSGYIDFLQVTGAGEEWITCAGGETIIIPINALHAFYNRTEKSARLLSISTQLHQAFFDAVEQTNQADRLASMPAQQVMACIGELARRFNMHFFPFSPPTLADRSSAERASICRSRRHEVRSKRHGANPERVPASSEGERDRGGDLSRGRIPPPHDRPRRE
jgi:quercetin dioxygenase-like cupin family protein